MHPNDYYEPKLLNIGGLDPMEATFALLNRKRPARDTLSLHRADALEEREDAVWDRERFDRRVRAFHRSSLGPCHEVAEVPVEVLGELGVPNCFDGPIIDVARYDMDNDDGAAQQAIDYLRRTGNSDTRHLKRVTITIEVPPNHGVPMLYIGVPSCAITGGMYVAEQMEWIGEIPPYALPFFVVGLFMSVIGLALTTNA